MLNAPIGETRQVSKQASGSRVIAGRIFPKTDLIPGIKAICAEHGVKSGAIISCIGSLNYARFVWATPDPLRKAGFKYGEPAIIAGPIELVAAQGTIGTLESGELSVHMHAVMTGDTGGTWSGHIQDEGNPVCLTAEIFIMALDGVDLVRKPDNESGMTLFELQ